MGNPSVHFHFESSPLRCLFENDALASFTWFFLCFRHSFSIWDSFINLMHSKESGHWTYFWPSQLSQLVSEIIDIFLRLGRIQNKCSINLVNIVSLIVHTFYLDTIYSLPLHRSCLNHIDILYRIPIPWVYIVHYHISILEYQSIDIFSPVRKLPLKENKYLKEALQNSVI